MAAVDRNLIFINLGLLLGIISIPFTTSLAATWFNQGLNAKLAVGIYCANWVYVSAFFILIICHLIGTIPRKGYVGIVSYLTATAFSLVYPVAAFSIYLILAVYYVFGVALEVREKE